METRLLISLCEPTLPWGSFARADAPQLCRLSPCCCCCCCGAGVPSGPPPPWAGGARPARGGARASLAAAREARASPALGTAAPKRPRCGRWGRSGDYNGRTHTHAVQRCWLAALRTWVGTAGRCCARAFAGCRRRRRSSSSSGGSSSRAADYRRLCEEAAPAEEQGEASLGRCRCGPPWGPAMGAAGRWAAAPRRAPPPANRHVDRAVRRLPRPAMTAACTILLLALRLAPGERRREAGLVARPKDRAIGAGPSTRCRTEPAHVGPELDGAPREGSARPGAAGGPPPS